MRRPTERCPPGGGAIGSAGHDRGDDRRGRVQRVRGGRVGAAGRRLRGFFGPIVRPSSIRCSTPRASRAGTRVLDVATGPGYVAAGAAAPRRAVMGVDVAESMVALARRAAPGARLTPGRRRGAAVRRRLVRRGGGELPPAAPRPPGAGGGEFARVLAPGGRVALTGRDSPSARVSLACSWTRWPPPARRRRRTFRPGRRSSASRTTSELARLFAGAGLEDVEVQTVAFGYPWPSPDALWRGLLGGTVRTRRSSGASPRGAAADPRRLRPHRGGRGGGRPSSSPSR